MAISYTPVDLRGEVLEEVFTELLFDNKTIADGLVTLHDSVKADTIITQFGTTVTMQAYTPGPKVAAGSIGINDKSITPIKVMFFDTFETESLRTSRFKRDMSKGAINIDSNELNQLLITNLSPKISVDCETKFWNGATAATKAAVALLVAGAGQGSVGAAEQALVAAMPTTLFDSIPATMIFNSPNAATAAGVGARVKVAGAVITVTNIATEYGVKYAAIPSVVLNQAGATPFIYAPFSHKKLIHRFNVAQTNRDTFIVIGEKYYFLGVEIKFVPLPENVMIVALPENIHWLTDVFSDLNQLKIDKVETFQESMAYLAVMTEFAWVTRQLTNVLYVG